MKNSEGNKRFYIITSQRDVGCFRCLDRGVLRQRDQKTGRQVQAFCDCSAGHKAREKQAQERRGAERAPWGGGDDRG